MAFVVWWFIGLWSHICSNSVFGCVVYRARPHFFPLPWRLYFDARMSTTWHVCMIGSTFYGISTTWHACATLLLDEVYSLDTTTLKLQPVSLRSHVFDLIAGLLLDQPGACTLLRMTICNIVVVRRLFLHRFLPLATRSVTGARVCHPNNGRAHARRRKPRLRFGWGDYCLQSRIWKQRKRRRDGGHHYRLGWWVHIIALKDPVHTCSFFPSNSEYPNF